MSRNASQAAGKIYFRLLLLLSVLSFFLAGLVYFFPDLDMGPNVLVLGGFYPSLPRSSSGDGCMSGSLAFRSSANGSTCWAAASGLAPSPRLCAPGAMRAWKLWVETAKARLAGEFERFAADLRAFSKPKPSIDRVIVAMEDRRRSMPVRELLDLRLRGVVIEDASAIMERLLGKLPLDGLNPSSLIFTHGFNVKASQQILRRLVSITASFILLAICLPFIPFIILAVRLSFAGAHLFPPDPRGTAGRPFSVIKFRTMRQDAESKGAVWATKNDPRVTPLGRFHAPDSPG